MFNFFKKADKPKIEDLQKAKLAVIREFSKAKFSVYAKPGDNIPYEFTHSNKTAEIEAVKPGCGCVEPDSVSKNKIEGIFKIPAKSKANPYVTTASVYFDDGEPFVIIEDGILKNNPKKLKATLTFEAKFKSL